MTSDEQCAVCGTEDEPESGWILRSTHVTPDRVEDGELRFRMKEDADPLCSVDCLDEYKEEQGDG